MAFLEYHNILNIIIFLHLLALLISSWPVKLFQSLQTVELFSFGM